VFEQIKMELDLHTHIEEKIFYPALEKPRQTHDLTLEAYEEHDVVKKLLREMSRAKSADEEWQAQAKVLQENVEHHVEEEENELFPKASAALGEEQIEELGEQLAAEKNRKQKTAGKTSSAKKASGSSKTASKTKSASTAAKRTRSTAAKKGGTRKAASGSKSRSTKSAKKK
jgi:iron-sulfur cluster repair protein YtfE (RIC family)